MQATDIDVTDNPDIVSPPSSPSDNATPAAAAAALGVSALDPEDQPPPSQQSGPESGEGSAQGSSSVAAGVLRRYIENFDQQTMIDTARLVRDAASLSTVSSAQAGR